MSDENTNAKMHELITTILRGIGKSDFEIAEKLEEFDNFEGDWFTIYDNEEELRMDGEQLSLI